MTEKSPKKKKKEGDGWDLLVPITENPMSVLWLPSMIDAAALTMSRAVFRSVFILYPVVLQQAGSRNSHTVAQWLQHSRSHIISKPREVSVSSFLY